MLKRIKSPKITVIMSAFNEQEFISETIKSILNQTFSDFEFIIIDDGSQDKTFDCIKRFNDPRILIIRQSNIGLTKSLNKGIRISKGEYIARVDAQELYHPSRFEKQVKFLDANPNIAVVSNWARFVDKKGNLIYFKKRPCLAIEIKRFLGFLNPIIHTSCMIRKKFLIKIGGYNENFPYAQDYELWLRLATKYELANIPEFLCTIKVSSQGISTIKTKEQIKCAFMALISSVKRKQYPYWIFFHPLNIRRFIPYFIPLWLKTVKRKIFGWGI